MATYEELRALAGDSPLSQKVEIATIIAANNLLTGSPSPTADEQKWAAAVFAAPAREGRKALMSVLAANNSASVAAITGASDAQIQNNVNAVVPALVVAYNNPVNTGV